MSTPEKNATLADRITERLAGRFLSHRRSLAVVLGLVTAFALVGLARIDFEDEPRKIYEQHDSKSAELNQLFADFGADDNDILVVIDGDEFFTPANVARLRQLALRLQQTPGIAALASIFDIRSRGGLVVPLMPGSESPPARYAAARRAALAHPLAAGQFLARDGRAMLMIARLEGESLVVSHLEAVEAQFRAAIREATAGSRLRVHLAGHPILRIDSLAGLRREMVKSLLLSTAISFLIAVLTFRRLAAVFVAYSGPAVAVVWTLGGMGWVGERVNALNNALPALILVIGFADAVHLLLHFRHSRSEGEDRPSAAADIIRQLWLTCLLTSGTAAVGFGSLAMAQTYSVQRFGLASVWGSLCAFIAVMTVVPLAASTRLGDRVGDHETPASRRWQAWTAVVVDTALDHPRAFTAGSLAACIGLLIPALSLRSDIIFSEAIPTDSETARAIKLCDEHFGGALQTTVVVEWPDDAQLRSPQVLAAVADVHRLIEAQPQATRAPSILDVMEEVAQWRRLPAEHVRRLVRTDRRRLVVHSRVPNVGAAVLSPVFAEIDRGLAELEGRYPGFSFRLTSTVVVAARNLHGIVEDVRLSLGTEAIVIFLIMTVGFRSLRLGLISIPSNLFPLAFMGAFLVAIGEPLRISSVMTFNICLGLAVNDTIHVLCRFRQERVRGDGVRPALERTMRSVGAAMVANTAILTGGFASLMVSRLPAIRTFGAISCVAMMAAVIGELLILPALIRCFVPEEPPVQPPVAPPA